MTPRRNAPPGRRRSLRRPVPPGLWKARQADNARDVHAADHLPRLAGFTGLPADTLLDVGAGYWAGGGVHTFPVRDDAGTAVGLRTAEPSGHGRFAAGSDGHGLFAPPGLLTNPPADMPALYVGTGPTDAAAFAAWGLPALCRATPHGGARRVLAWIGRANPAEAVVLAYPGGDGRRAAVNLANVLRTRVPARVAEFPHGIADARGWFVREATAGEVVATLNAAPVLPRVGGGKGAGR